MLNLGRAMRLRGHECLVAVPADGWVSKAAEQRGLPWLLYTGGRNGTRTETVRRLRRIVIDKGIDVIHAHMFDASVYSAAVSALTRVPLVSTIHGHADLKGSKRTQLAKCLILRAFASDVVFVSEALERQVLHDFPVIRAKARMIPNGIPISAESALKERNTFRSEQPFTFGALGNIREPKGYSVLLDAAAQICAGEQSIRIRIAGEPDKAGLYERLLKQREELGLQGCVEFLGHVADIQGFFESVDCVVSSSLTEGMPLSLIEAMAHALPIVATRCGGVPELIEHEKHGLLCEPGNADELAAAMLRMMGNPALREDVAKAASERAISGFSLDVMADRYERLYLKAVGKSTASR